MYEIFSETLIPKSPQQNDTNVMSPNDKGKHFLLNKSDNSMSLKDQEILMEKPPTTNEEDVLMDDPLYAHLKDLRLENPKSIIFSHVNINNLKKEANAPLDYFKYILNKHFIYILCISESKLNDSIVEKDIDCSPNFKVYRKYRSSISDGLCIWIRSDIPQQRLYNFEIDYCVNHIESMICELKIKKQLCNNGLQKSQSSKQHVYKQIKRCLWEPDK